MKKKKPSENTSAWKIYSSLKTKINTNTGLLVYHLNESIEPKQNSKALSNIWHFLCSYFLVVMETGFFLGTISKYDWFFFLSLGEVFHSNGDTTKDLTDIWKEKPIKIG